MSTAFKSGFGNRLKEERKRLGETQHGFAEKAKIKRVTQFLYEKEESFPNYRYLTIIADLGVDMNYLFFGKRQRSGYFELTPQLLRDIYRIVDEIARDDDGNLLPLETRLNFYSILCATYSGRGDTCIDLDQVRIILNK